MRHSRDVLPCTDNGRIKAIYGNYTFEAWRRYLDSADFVTLMLMDKGYYDYDFLEPKNVRQHADAGSILTYAGFGKVKRVGDSMTTAELQKEVMAEVSSK